MGLFDRFRSKEISGNEPGHVFQAVSVIRCAAGTVLQPVKGAVIPREAIPDETFASGMLGDVMRSASNPTGWNCSSM